MDLPLLYTFRRCPYAIRARLAIAVAGLNVTQVEVSLRDKPAAMLSISPKGTVPVLLLPDGSVLAQSLEIMHWALTQHDPHNWLDAYHEESRELVWTNDSAFKRALDQYKYPARYPGTIQSAVRDIESAPFLRQLESHLQKRSSAAQGASTGLFGAGMRFADAAIFPFIRQFAAVDADWWQQSPYPYLREWLAHWQSAALFIQVMKKNA